MFFRMEIKFLRFMKGFEQKGSIIHGVSQKRCFDPLDTVINFAVPHENVLSGFCPVESMKDYKTVGPGKVEPVLNIYASSKREQSQILTFDGKKIIPNTAKIDLLGCEDADIEIKQLINEMVQLYEKTASETVVFSTADTNRIYNREIGHGMPMGYFLKGYGLTSNCMRRIEKKM